MIKQKIQIILRNIRNKIANTIANKLRTLRKPKPAPVHQVPNNNVEESIYRRTDETQAQYNERVPIAKQPPRAQSDLNYLGQPVSRRYE